LTPSLYYTFNTVG